MPGEYEWTFCLLDERNGGAYLVKIGASRYMIAGQLNIVFGVDEICLGNFVHPSAHR